MEQDWGAMAAKVGRAEGPAGQGKSTTDRDETTNRYCERPPYPKPRPTSRGLLGDLLPGLQVRLIKYLPLSTGYLRVKTRIPLQLYG